MRPPVVKRPPSPQSGFVRFAASRAWRPSPRATWSDLAFLGWRGQPGAAPTPSCGATASVMASAERRGRGCCARATSLSPPPVLRTRGAAQRWAPGRSRGGAGAAHRHPEARTPWLPARPPASDPTRRGRGERLGAPARAPPPAAAPGGARGAGCPSRAPVRPPARPRRARSPGEPGADRRPCPVGAWHRPSGRAGGPRRAPPGPCRAWARRGPAPVDPPEGCGGTGLPRRRRPTCETPCRSACRRGPRAARPLPGRPGPRGQRTRPLGPVASGRGPGAHPSARPCGSGPGPGPAGARPGGGPRAVGLW